MRILKTFLSVSALLAVIPNAHATSAAFGCFETQTAAEQFVTNIKSFETSYHETEKKRRELLGNSDESYRSLRDMLGYSPYVSLIPLKSDQTETLSVLTQEIFHKHLVPGNVKLNDAGQYCSKILHEEHTYVDNWTVDVENNKVLTSTSQTEIAR